MYMIITDGGELKIIFNVIELYTNKRMASQLVPVTSETFLYELDEQIIKTLDPDGKYYRCNNGYVDGTTYFPSKMVKPLK